MVPGDGIEPPTRGFSDPKYFTLKSIYYAIPYHRGKVIRALSIPPPFGVKPVLLIFSLFIAQKYVA